MGRPANRRRNKRLRELHDLRNRLGDIPDALKGELLTQWAREVVHRADRLCDRSYQGPGVWDLLKRKELEAELLGIKADLSEVCRIALAVRVQGGNGILGKSWLHG